MSNIKVIFFTVLLLFLPIISFADIIVTNDDMIINGKIIKEVKGEYVTLANNHGIFKINFNNIKDIQRTSNYQEDIKVFNKLGQTVDETEVKKNYETGIKKLEELNIDIKEIKPDLIIIEPDIKENEAETIKIEQDTKDTEIIPKDIETDFKDIKPDVVKIKQPSLEFLLFLSPFINFNFKPFDTIMPYGYGVLIGGNILFQKKILYLPAGTGIEMQYFHSGEAVKNIDGFRFAAGPIWIIPLKYLNLSFSATFGIGYYGIKGVNEKKEALKFNFTFASGPEFFISSWMISPKIRFDYIHDGVAPLCGIGISVEAGYRFQFFK